MLTIYRNETIVKEVMIMAYFLSRRGYHLILTCTRANPGNQI